MSPLRHDHRVSITICEAELVREGSWDRHHAGKELVTIDMTSEQFARLLTGGNTHSGVPCTLRRVGEKSIESPPVQLKSERYYDEAKEKVAEAVSVLDQLSGRLDGLLEKVPLKTKAKIADAVGSARNALADHLPWVVQMMHEHMDKVVNQAKVEVETYVNQRMGDVPKYMPERAEAPKMLSSLPEKGLAPEVDAPPQQAGGHVA